jgi:hypothetical protein
MADDNPSFAYDDDGESLGDDGEFLGLLDCL